MSHRAKTLRNLPPVTRKYVRLVDALQSVHTRLSNLIDQVHDLELLAKAEQARELHQASKPEPEDLPDILTYESTGIERPEL